VEWPDTRYARSGDVHIAYQVNGDGPFDLVFVPPFVSHVELAWEIPSSVTLIAAVKRGEHGAPTCEHGRWTFAGADFKRGATKWRCPSGECQPKSTLIKADRRNPLIPRETSRFRNLYRGRAAVEREFGRLKNEYRLAPLRVRGLERVALHADLVMLARLSQALARVRAMPRAA